MRPFPLLLLTATGMAADWPPAVPAHINHQLGEQRVLVMFPDWPDKENDTWMPTAETIAQIEAGLNNRFRQRSLYATGIRLTVVPKRIPMSKPKNKIGDNQVFTETLAAAQQMGYNPADYDRHWFPEGGFGSTGQAQLGGKRIWATWGDSTTYHEFAHSYGQNHENTIDISYHQHPFDDARWGWLKRDAVNRGYTRVFAAGTYRLYDRKAAALPAAGARALLFRTSYVAMDLRFDNGTGLSVYDGNPQSEGVARLLDANGDAKGLFLPFSGTFTRALGGNGPDGKPLTVTLTAGPRISATATSATAVDITVSFSHPWSDQAPTGGAQVVGVWPLVAGAGYRPKAGTTYPTVITVADLEHPPQAVRVRIDGTVVWNQPITDAAVVGNGIAWQTKVTWPYTPAASAIGAHQLIVEAQDAVQGWKQLGSTLPFAVVAGGSNANQLPTAGLLTPQSGGNYSAPATIVVAAEASDPDGTINRVEFYAGSTKIGQDSTSPYTMTWSGIAAGTYNLTAQAVDNEGAVGVSAARTITVQSGDDDDALPSPWTTVAIGNPAVSGNATHADGQFTVIGGGKDIWGTSDSFRFVSQPLTGNGTLSARVVSQTNTDPWAKAGVMLRDGMGATARHAMVVATPKKGISFQRRITAGGASAHTAGSTAMAPRWVRLVRAGDVITGAESANGSTWTTIGSATIALPATVRAGLCVTSHNNSTASTAVFAQVALAPSGGG